VVLAVYLVWALRSLIVPACVGALLAYICRPLVTRLERYRIPRGLAVALLLLVFASVALGIVNSLRAVMPTEAGALELRVRALYALNRHYQTLMGLDPSWTRGNRVYQLAHRELDPLMDRVREALALTTDERAQFVASRERGTERHQRDRIGCSTRSARTRECSRCVRAGPGAPNRRRQRPRLRRRVPHRQPERRARPPGSATSSRRG
jgi:hypothetical protein